MIIQIRGASGSGKSTLVRRFVEEHGPPLRYMMAKAEAMGMGHVDCPPSRPFALELPKLRTVIPGHYESSGGGADMIKSKAHIYDVAELAMREGRHVLVESLFLSKDTRETLDRMPGWPTTFKIIYLEVPEEVCLASVHARRAALGREYRPLKQHARDFKEVASAVSKLQGKVDIEGHTRDSAARRIRELLA